MLKYDFHDSIPYFVFTAAHAIEKAMGAALEGHGITFRQCQMLGMLATHGSLSQAQVAEMMGVEPSSVARLVDRMTRDGWIERRPDPDDRRKYQLFSTERAEPIWEGVQQVAASVRDTALEGLDEGDVSELKRMLRHLRNNLTDDPCRYPDMSPPDSALRDDRSAAGDDRSALSDDRSELSDDRAPAAVASASR